MSNAAEKILTNEKFENFKNSEIVDGFVDNIIFGKKFGELSKYVHEDVMINSVSGIRGTGFETHKKALSLWHNAFENVMCEPISNMQSGDEIMHHWSIKADHVGSYPGMEATGKKVNFNGVTIYKLRDGKIASINGYSDFGREFL